MLTFILLKESVAWASIVAQQVEPLATPLLIQLPGKASKGGQVLGLPATQVEDPGGVPDYWQWPDPVRGMNKQMEDVFLTSPSLPFK